MAFVYRVVVQTKSASPEGRLLKMGILMSVPLPTSQMICEKWDASFPNPLSHFSNVNYHLWILTSHFLRPTSHAIISVFLVL